VHLIGIGNYATRGSGLGQTPTIMVCPECSYFDEGSCLACADGDPHPACNYCEDGVYRPPAKPWYQNTMVQTVLVLVTASVLSGLLVHRLDHWISGRKVA